MPTIQPEREEIELLPFDQRSIRVPATGGASVGTSSLYPYL
jgi:hypothetical protein